MRFERTIEIATNFSGDDHVFFRKVEKNIDELANNPWHEFATRGTNTFKGHQFVDGDINLTQGSSVLIGDKLGYKLRIHSAVHSADNHGTFIDYHDNLMIRVGADNEGLRNVVYFSNTGNIYIGPNSTTELGVNGKIISKGLDVNGSIRAQEIKIEAGNWPDYVFSPSYRLQSLSDVEKYIQENNHLPNIPSEQEVKEEGISVGEMNAKLLQKIEEMTLYMIQMQKEIDELKKTNKP